MTGRAADLCGRHQGVKIGAKFVARDTGSGLDLEHVFGRKRLTITKPLEDRLLRHADEASQSRLRADLLNRRPQSYNFR